MKTISISTDVFAELWKRHQPGDQNEDEILRRVLKLPALPPADKVETLSRSEQSGGYVDDRYGVKVPEGFEIFRIYKGQEFKAKATGGKWLLQNNGISYPSLHKLSWAVVNGHENAWYNWKCHMPNGSENYINALRDTSKVTTRV